MSELVRILNPGWALLENSITEIGRRNSYKPNLELGEEAHEANRDLGIRLSRGLTPREAGRILRAYGIEVENHTKHPQLVAPDSTRRVFPGYHMGKSIPLGELKAIEKFANQHGNPKKHS